ncbi:MAG: DUF309 domain-containing protein [Geobacter sp.]|nr:DUF309 domain-containing protein [Geobacter sp.]
MGRTDCSDAPSGAILKALGEFNRGDWFDCHETLEDLWVGSEDEPRWFYQGLLQVAVALHHWRNGNYGGAISLLGGGIGYLQRVRPVCQRIEIARLIAEAERFREELTRLGPERMAEMPAAMFPKMRLAPTVDCPPEP